jgi:hypothetical protein
MNLKGPFSQLLLEFGSDAEADESVQKPEDITSMEQESTSVSRLSRKHVGKAAGTGKLEVSDDPLLPSSDVQGRLMVSETRKTGSVGWKGGLNLTPD